MKLHQRTSFHAFRVRSLHRCAENSRPFTIERFEGDIKEDAKREEDDPCHLDTSDYHSATSSDCGSAASSDGEEEAKDDRKEATKKELADEGACTVTMVPRIQKRHVGKNKAKYVRNMVILLGFFVSLNHSILVAYSFSYFSQTSVPYMEDTGTKHRLSHRGWELSARTMPCLGTHAGYFSVQVPTSLQYVYHPTPAWPQKGAAVFLNTVCAPPTAPPPPQQLLGYYILPQPPPQFILPQASLQRWGSAKG